ncbi:MAG: hypothetical protein Q8Q50_05410, partial [Methylobacter sp.]|nr:hypothetical protein [Methylobacter sp.]
MQVHEPYAEMHLKYQAELEVRRSQAGETVKIFRIQAILKSSGVAFFSKIQFFLICSSFLPKPSQNSSFFTHIP